MYEVSSVNAKLRERFNFYVYSNLSYIASIFFKHVRKDYATAEIHP